MADSNQPTTAEMSGGQPPKDGAEDAAVTSRIDQPKDAVPMADLPQSSSTPAAADAAEPAASSSDAPAQAQDASAAAAIPSEDAAKPAAADDKGKSKETEPVSESAAAPPTTMTETTTTTPAAAAAAAAPTAAPEPPAKATRQDSLAIGPSVDHVQPVGPANPSEGPVCNITLLLTTGARHPYRIDERYLTKRSVSVPGKTDDGKIDPFSISVYTLKELILREWREEWDAKPASPSSIRLIHFGKLLDDKDQLKQYHFSAESANVVHMTVRPADIIEEEEPKGGNKSASGRGRPGGGGGCCVIL